MTSASTMRGAFKSGTAVALCAPGKNARVDGITPGRAERVAAVRTRLVRKWTPARACQSARDRASAR